jgi:hypothetical protein
MRRVAGLLFAAILLLSLPTLAPAAGLFGMGSYGFPSFFGGTNGSSCCDPGSFCCPSVYVGYEIRQSRNRKPLNYGASGPANASNDFTVVLGNQFNVDASDPGGLWLGVSEYCQISNCLGIMASGWYLFPSNGDAQEAYGGVGTIDEEENFAVNSRRTWRTSRSWGWLDAMAVLGSPCGLNLIAGFRWDSYSVRLTDPRPAGVSFDGFTWSTAESDLTVNSYIPLIGTQYCCGGPCCGLLIRVVGFPWVPSRVRWGETFTSSSRLEVDSNFNRASFLEVFSEYSRNFTGFGCIGIFARWNHFEGRGTTSPKLVGTLPFSLTLPNYDYSLNRSSWAVGGKIALSFGLPF